MLKHKKDLKNIYISAKLSLNDTVFLSKEISNRLKKVMRFKKGWEFAVFNTIDGLFLAEILDSDCQNILIKEKLKDQPKQTTKTLFLPILKKEALSNAMRQATELGIDVIQPVITEFTVEHSLKIERYEQIILGACEQSERLTIPKLKEPTFLKEAIDSFDGKIFWACERTDKNSSGKFFNNDGILIGPEGGFSENEKEFLSLNNKTISYSLGSMILKADTAVVASLIKFNDMILD